MVRRSAFNLVQGLVGDNCGGLRAQNLVRRSAFNLVHGFIWDSSSRLSAQNTVRRLVGGTGGTGAEGFAATTLRHASLQ